MDPGGNRFQESWDKFKEDVSDRWNEFKDRFTGNVEDAGGDPGDGDYGYTHSNGETLFSL